MREREREERERQREEERERERGRDICFLFLITPIFFSFFPSAVCLSLSSQCVCVCACVRACVRACARVCVTGRKELGCDVYDDYADVCGRMRTYADVC